MSAKRRIDNPKESYPANVNKKTKLEENDITNDAQAETLPKNNRMSHYKLTYFNWRGRAELMRYIFSIAGKRYEDERIDDAAWALLKPKTPFGKLPILEVDGEVLGQSAAIARYLARQFGLAGKSELESARVDMIVDCNTDAYKPLDAILEEKDESKKAELERKYIDEQLPESYRNLEEMLKSNNGGDGYFVGNTVTWADLQTVLCFEVPSFQGLIAPIDKFPKLKALKDRVESIPAIEEWIKNRPQTPW